jgi:hypothetical protein
LYEKTFKNQKMHGKKHKNFVFRMNSGILFLYKLSFLCMQRLFYIALAVIVGLMNHVHAESGTVDKKSIVGDSSFNTKLRSGDVTFNDIPAMIVYATEFFLAIAGTVSIVAIIYGAIKMQIHSDAFGGHNNEE